MNEGDFQVRAVHKILGYDPIQKSFATPKYVIRPKILGFKRSPSWSMVFSSLKGLPLNRP